MKDDAGHAKVSSRIILYHTLRSCGQRLRTDQNWIRSFEQHVLAISSRLLPYPTLSSWNRPRMSVDDPGVLSVQFYSIFAYSILYDVYWCLLMFDVIDIDLLRSVSSVRGRRDGPGTGLQREGKSFYGFEMFRRHDECIYCDILNCKAGKVVWAPVIVNSNCLNCLLYYLLYSVIILYSSKRSRLFLFWNREWSVKRWRLHELTERAKLEISGSLSHLCVTIEGDPCPESIRYWRNFDQEHLVRSEIQELQDIVKMAKSKQERCPRRATSDRWLWYAWYALVDGRKD